MAEAARPSDGSPGVDVMAEGGYTGEHFVERHRVELIKRVSNIKPILDELLRQKIISRYSYDQMKPLPTSQEKMAELFRWPLPVSGGEGNKMFYKLLNEHEPHLIHELRRTEEPVEAGLPVRELLLETLHDLRDKELKRFNWLLLWKFFLCGFSRHLWRQLESLHTAKNLVDVMVQTWGQRSVEVTKEVLVDMNRTDLVQRLPTWGHKEDHSLVELWPELNPKLVETMASAIELLLETLKDLTDRELKMLQHLFLGETHNLTISSDIRWLLSDATDVQDVVFVIVLTCGRLSVTDTMKFLHEMNRTDLVQKLSHSSSGAQKKLSSEHRPALIQRAARKAAVRPLLLGIVVDFSYFKEILTSIISQNNPFSLMLRRTFGRESVVDLMLETFGLHSVDLTCEVLEMMGRSHTIRWSLSNSFFEVKASGRERETVGERAQDEPAQSESTKTSVQESLLQTMKDLNDEDLEKFKRLLQSTQREKGLLRIPKHRLERADRVEMVKLMMEAYDQSSVEVTRKVLKRMFWEDLQERLSKRPWRRFLSKRISTVFSLSSSRPPPWTSDELLSSEPLSTDWGASKNQSSVQENPYTMECLSLRLHRSQLGGGEGSTWTGHQPIAVQTQQGSSEWTKLDPEVNSEDADDAPTYRLQSKAGNYECSVSGLRWICNGTVSFKYQFCSWEEHMKRMKSLQYMPAGPLMDITVVTGRFDEVHLPHWICIENNHRKTNNKILDKFAVLHINDCGDDVEKVSQVTSSHVKLSEPVFSPRAVLLRMGIPVRINCNVLIYKTNTAFLTLHVYLIPRDPGLQQEMDRRQISDGYKVIKKPQPNTSLKMNDRFILTAVLKGAEITPEDLKLRCGSSPNFYEVYSQNPDTDFELVLNHKKDHQTVWKRTIRKDEYQSIDHIHAATPSAGAAGVNTTAPDGSAEKNFVDEHRTALINRVTNVAAILDDLLDGEVISKGSYEEIMALSTRRDQMRKLFSGPLDGSGRAGKDIFYKILEKKEKFLMKDLQKKE